MPTYTAAEMDNAAYSPLTARPKSSQAIEACACLLRKLLHQSPRRPNKAQVQAFGAVIADLLERDPTDHGGWLYRSTASGSFSGHAVGYRPFVRVFEAMSGHMIEVVNGNRQWAQNELTGGRRVPERQRATRFRATEWLRNWFEQQGITRANWEEHFEREASARPNAAKSVTLRARKRPGGTSGGRGRSMVANAGDPAYRSEIARMERLNSYLAMQTFTPFGPVFLRRIFSNGDDPAFAWNMGGRVYALGAKTYQTAKKAERAEITINGGPTVEIDIRASHVTILVGLGALPNSVLDGDPYEVEGLPREIVKQWVTMTISHGKRHVRWPKDARDAYLAEHGGSLSTAYPITSTGDRILRKLPLLDGESNAASVSWAELQYRESEVLLETLETLAFAHDVPALPVHDSLIVPVAGKDLARETLARVFNEQVGIVPTIG